MGDKTKKHTDGHAIPEGELFKLSKEVREPVMVLRGHNKNPDSIVLITEMENVTKKPEKIFINHQIIKDLKKNNIVERNCMKKKDLYIPVNVPDRNELIPGFGTMELTLCGISTAVAIIVAIVMYISGVNVLYAVGTAAVIITLTILIFRKDKYGENLLFKTQYVIAFHKSQKKYQYQYHNIYEGSVRK